ncbi:cell division protein FtsA [Weissella tructae]
MANHGMIVGLDVGTNTVKVLAADVRDQQANIIAVGRSVSHGVNKGVVVDIDSTANDIRQAVAQVNEQANEAVTDVIALLPAKDIQMSHVEGTVTVEESQHISYHDVAAVVQESLKGQVSHDREVIEMLPEEFIVDDFDGIQDPNDMVGMRLGMRATVYTAPRNLVRNLRMAIEKADLNVRDMVLTPVAEGKTILSDAEQEFGTILLDMGAGQTTATVIQDRMTKFITTFPAGGDNITRDISTVLSIGGYDADMLKLDAGVALVDHANGENQVMIQKVGEDEPERISEKHLAEIVEARTMQILTKLQEPLAEADALSVPGGVTLIGGTATLRGMPDAVSAVFDMKAREFAPDDIGLRHPGMSGVWAVVQYAALQTPVQLIVKQALYGLPLYVVGKPQLGAPFKAEKKAFFEPKQETRTTRPAIERETIIEDDEIDTNNQIEDEKKSARAVNFLKDFFD